MAPASLNIPKERLLELYVGQMLSTGVIAKQLACNHVTVLNYLKKYGIPRRSRLGNRRSVSIDKETLINLYHNKKFTQKQIAQKFGHSRFGIQKWMKIYGNVHIWKAKRGTFEIVVLLNQTFDFLLPKFDMIDEWIINNGKYFLSFLAGYSDAEGCILIRKSTHGNKRPFAGFELATYDKNILNQIGMTLEKLSLVFPKPFITSRAGVDKRGVKRNKDCWRISIYRKDSLWKLLNLLEPFMKHSEKLNSLSNAKKNIISRNNIPYSRPINLNTEILA